MKINNPLRISIFLSTVITLVLILMILFFQDFRFIQNDPTNILFLVFFFFFIMVCTYMVTKNFFHEKIKVIYKNIYKFKGTSRLDKLNDLDIDHVQKEAEDWANAKQNELEQMKQDENYRRDFIGNVSHELKTPIFNIQGYVETLLDGGLDDDEINVKYLKRANKSIERMINIVEDLEVISHLETEQSELEIENVIIEDVVNEVFDLLEMKANNSKISLQLINEARAVSVRADKNKLQQVFVNLIHNSIKYGKKNGKTRVSFFDMGPNILIEIADNGIGIDEDSLPRLFERFYRVDKNRSREIGGTGLGLSIVKHILEAHNQTINVRSTKNVGSTFSFILEKGE